MAEDQEKTQSEKNDISNKSGVGIDVPFLKENPAKNQQEIAHIRRMELMDVVKLIGFKNARKQYKTWAKHYKVNQRRIYEDFDWIKGNFKPADAREVKIDLRIARDRAFEETMMALQESNNPQDKVKAASALMSIAKAYREELEAWGEKEKVADKHEVNIAPSIFNLVEKSVEEIKNERSGDKPQTEGNTESPK